MGYRPGSVEAFYFDRALWLWGTRIEAEMDKAESKVKSKNRNMAAAARNQVLNSYIRPKGEKNKGVFRDPALQFSKKPGVHDGIVIGGDSFG